MNWPQIIPIVLVVVGAAGVGTFKIMDLIRDRRDRRDDGALKLDRHRDGSGRSSGKRENDGGSGSGRPGKDPRQTHNKTTVTSSKRIAEATYFGSPEDWTDTRAATPVVPVIKVDALRAVLRERTSDVRLIRNALAVSTHLVNTLPAAEQIYRETAALDDALGGSDSQSVVRAAELAVEQPELISSGYAKHALYRVLNEFEHRGNGAVQTLLPFAEPVGRHCRYSLIVPNRGDEYDNEKHESAQAAGWSSRGRPAVAKVVRPGLKRLEDGVVEMRALVELS